MRDSSGTSGHIWCNVNHCCITLSLYTPDALHPFTYYRKYKYIKSIGGDRGISGAAGETGAAVSRGAAL